MKVALLNDLPVAGPDSSGFGSGAELSSGHFIMEGNRRGHRVTVLTPEYLKPDNLEDYDLLVTKNVVNFQPSQLNAIMTHPYVTWPSDYAWTRWRLFFSFQEEQRRNPDLPRWREFFTKSRLNVFLSPLHADAYDWVMPGILDHPHILSPPPVNVDAFHPNPKGWDPKTACTINGGLEFKGLKGFPDQGVKGNLDWAIDHPDIEFRFIGALRDGVNLPPNAKHLGHVSNKRLANILGTTETYVELPSTCQPFNRSAIEGFLSCKKVVTNRLLGAASYPWFASGDREACRMAIRDAMPKLWEALEKA